MVVVRRKRGGGRGLLSPAPIPHPGVEAPAVVNLIGRGEVNEGPGKEEVVLIEVTQVMVDKDPQL